MQPRIAPRENARTESPQSAGSNCQAGKVIERINAPH
jgi:hypothetical protein